MEARPTPDEAAAALLEADVSRTQVAESFVLPAHFYSSIGVAAAGQIATTALELADLGTWAWVLLVVGLTVFVLVAAVQLVRFRRLNGVWLGGLASRVVGGTATAASVSFGLSLGAAIWAAFAALWWLVPVCAIAGGVGYAVSGRRWVRVYRSEPAAHGRGESAIWLGVLTVLALAGLVLLVAGR